MTSGLYKIINTTNGYVYIGASMDIEKRIEQHRWELQRGRHQNTVLQEAWNHDGADAFQFAILERITDPERIRLREQHHLHKLLYASYKTFGPARNYNGVYTSAFKGKREQKREG